MTTPYSTIVYATDNLTIVVCVGQQTMRRIDCVGSFSRQKVWVTVCVLKSSGKVGSIISANNMLHPYHSLFILMSTHTIWPRHPTMSVYVYLQAEFYNKKDQIKS